MTAAHDWVFHSRSTEMLYFVRASCLLILVHITKEMVMVRPIKGDLYAAGLVAFYNPFSAWVTLRFSYSINYQKHQNDWQRTCEANAVGENNSFIFTACVKSVPRYHFKLPYIVYK